MTSLPVGTCGHGRPSDLTFSLVLFSIEAFSAKGCICWRRRSVWKALTFGIWSLRFGGTSTAAHIGHTGVVAISKSAASSKLAKSAF